MFTYDSRIHYFTSNKDPNMAKNLTYILALCNLDPTTERAKNLKNNMREFIDYFFSLRYNKNNTYASTFIDAIFRLCKNKEMHEYVIQKIYETMLVTRQNYSSVFYKSNTQPAPYVILFIDGHAKELDEPIQNTTNLLSYNWAAAPGLISYPINDADNIYLLETFQNALRAHPATFTEFIENIGTIKSKYISPPDNTLSLNYSAALTDMYHKEDNTKLYELTEKYKNYAFSLIKPIKNKLYNFNQLLCPGIYVLAVVNSQIENASYRLFNLLIHDDMVDFNRLFKMPDTHGIDIFKNEIIERLGVSTVITNDVDITLNDICTYFNSINITNIGVLDYTCRYKKDFCETKMKKQMIIDELGAHKKFRTFGGEPSKTKKTGKKRREKKKTRTKK